MVIIETECKNAKLGGIQETACNQNWNRPAAGIKNKNWLYPAKTFETLEP